MSDDAELGELLYEANGLAYSLDAAQDTRGEVGVVWLVGAKGAHWCQHWYLEGYFSTHVLIACDEVTRDVCCPCCKTPEQDVLGSM